MSNDLTTRARKAIKQIRENDERASYEDGLLGRINPSGPPTFVPRGRAGWKYVRIGTLPPVPARDNIGVPESRNLPVRVKKEIIVPGSGVITYSIVAILRDESLATVPGAPSSGVPIHHHNNLYFQETEFINVSAGAADAGKPIVLAATGQVDPSMIDLTSVDIGAVVHAATVETTPLDADETLILDSASSFALRRITWTTLKAFLKTYFDTLYELVGAIATHAALTVTHGATGAIVGTTNTQTLTDKTLTAPTIADFTNAAHDHGDADDGGNIPYTSVTGGPTQYTDELAQDAVGGMFTGNVETDIAATYQDATAKIDLVVSPTIVGDRIHAAASKATPVAADEWGFWDSVDSLLKKLTTTQLVTWLTTLFVDRMTAQTVAGDKTLSGTTTISQGSPLRGTAPGVGHGFTSLVAADVYVMIEPVTPTGGGLKITAFTDTDHRAFAFFGYIGHIDPANDTPGMSFGAGKLNGTTKGPLAAEETLAEFSNDGAVVVVIKGDGKVGVLTVTPTAMIDLPAGTTARASLRLRHGVAPTTPNDGDMWTTTAGLFVRINGATVGPLT